LSGQLHYQSAGSTLSGLKLLISCLTVGFAKGFTHGYCYWAPSALWLRPRRGRISNNRGCSLPACAAGRRSGTRGYRWKDATPSPKGANFNNRGCSLPACASRQAKWNPRLPRNKTKEDL